MSAGLRFGGMGVTVANDAGASRWPALKMAGQLADGFELLNICADELALIGTGLKEGFDAAERAARIRRFERLLDMLE